MRLKNLRINQLTVRASRGYPVGIERQGTGQMAITVRKSYVDEIGNECHFVKLENVPGSTNCGFSHRVIVNRKQVAWLSKKFRPSEKCAEFFIEKHGNKSAN